MIFFLESTELNFTTILSILIFANKSNSIQYYMYYDNIIYVFCISKYSILKAIIHTNIINYSQNAVTVNTIQLSLFILHKDTYDMI